jgi:hypothetical protein
MRFNQGLCNATLAVLFAMNFRSGPEVRQSKCGCPHI